jgi:hypothetical protein
MTATGPSSPLMPPNSYLCQSIGMPAAVNTKLLLASSIVGWTPAASRRPDRIRPCIYAGFASRVAKRRPLPRTVGCARRRWGRSPHRLLLRAASVVGCPPLRVLLGLLSLPAQRFSRGGVAPQRYRVPYQ